MTSTILIIMAVLLVVVYLGYYITKKHELPESLSAMVYDLPSVCKWIWGAWLMGVAFCLFVPLVERNEWLGWLMEVSLFGAALTPLIKKDTLKWHYVAAIATGVISQVIVVVNDANWLSVWMLFVFLFLSSYVQPEGWLGRTMNGKEMFLCQMTCFVGLIGSLICRELIE